MPQMGVSVAEGTVVEWKVGVGDPVARRRDGLRDLHRQDRQRGAGAGRRGDERGAGGGRARRSPSGPCWRGSPAGAASRRRDGDGEVAAPAPSRRRVLARSCSGSPPSTASISRRVTGTGRDGRVRKQDVLALVARAEPPLHIESPYRPERRSGGGGARRRPGSSRGCGARSAST